VTGLVVPKTIDTGRVSSVAEALIVNFLLMTLFAVAAQPDGAQAIQAMVDAIRAEACRAQHLCVVRQPDADPVVLAVGVRCLKFFGIIEESEMTMTITAVSFVGWLMVLSSTFLINHFELFGLHQRSPTTSPASSRRRHVSGRAILQIRGGTRFISARHRVLGGAYDVGRAFVVRRGDHGLHLRRHLPWKRRPGRDGSATNTAATSSACRCCCPGVI